VARGFSNRSERAKYAKACRTPDGGFDMKAFNALCKADAMRSKTKSARRSDRRVPSLTADGCGPGAECPSRPENPCAAAERDAQNKTTGADPTRGHGNQAVRSMEGQEAGHGLGRNGEMTS